MAFDEILHWESAVVIDEPGLFCFRLGDEQTVEWIVVVRR